MVPHALAAVQARALVAMVAYALAAVVTRALAAVVAHLLAALAGHAQAAMGAAPGLAALEALRARAYVHVSASLFLRGDVMYSYCAECARRACDSFLP